ncbi:MAG: hypothetical protein NTW21_28265 [Verrucomicrobia bacterium]|nr:hypothetical protein [Verrucomicrobiota bacterium]
MSTEFPSDLNLKSQIATSSFGHGGRRKLPYAFTEHGAIMASNVLNSRQATQMSVFVVRAFVKNVFLSHSAKDKAVVRPLAERMWQDAPKLWSDEWKIPVAAVCDRRKYQRGSQPERSGDGQRQSAATTATIEAWPSNRTSFAGIINNR